MLRWFNRQSITIRGAIIGGLFAILAAFLTFGLDFLKPAQPVIVYFPATDTSPTLPPSGTQISPTLLPSATPTLISTDTPTPDATLIAAQAMASTPDASFAVITRVMEDGSNQVFVPSGWFVAGDTMHKGYPDEAVHPAYTDSFWIDRFLVTNLQYASCVEADICTGPVLLGSHKRPDGYFGVTSFNNYPVMEITWQQAKIYCEWRGARLPTEAEFEKAAGWNPKTGTVSLYPWGDEAPDGSLANYDGVDRDTTPIDRYIAGVSAVGAYDMAGNLWQWTQDWYSEKYYLENTNWVNPAGPASGGDKVIRGGSWYSNDTRWLRVANRGKTAPENAGNEFGFRCVFEK